MKKLILLSVVAALGFAGSKAMAAGSLVLNVSATARIQNVENDFKGTVTSKAISEKNVYTLVSNAVANADGFEGVALVPQHIPANGYIVYNPGSGDGFVEGFFYVTNKTGFYLPLSGFDTNGDYYSYAEFDTTIFFTDEEDNLNLGFYALEDDIFNSVASYNLVTTGANEGNGTSTSTSKALLYVHDYPYDYGDSNANDYNNFYPFNDNDNAIEIAGIATTKLNLVDFSPESGSLSMTGNGNFESEDFDEFGVIVSGHASL